MRLLLAAALPLYLTLVGRVSVVSVKWNNAEYSVGGPFWIVVTSGIIGARLLLR